MDYRGLWAAAALAAVGSVVFTPAVVAQALDPRAAPATAPIPSPRDVAFPGVIALDVDATDIARHVISVRQRVPATGGQTLTLILPEWLPGNHAPRGQIDKIAGIAVTAGGLPVTWRRDPVNVYAIHVEVPRGARQVELAFQFLSALNATQGRIVVGQDVMNLQWNNLLFYPAGFYATRIRYDLSLKLPEGWGHASALDVAEQRGAMTRFKTTDLESLVDSPMFAGRYFKSVDLDPGGPVPFRLNMVGDNAEEIEASEEQIAAHRKLVDEAYAAFGGRPFDRYDFLLAMSAQIGGIGLEHHRSSENNPGLGYFKKWETTTGARDLLPHELAHAWNGKYRRPADLWTPNYDVAMRNSLLWVYEGQTQFWGVVLAARSGLWTTQNALDEIALIAATLDNRAGRAWRPLVDTTFEPIISARRPVPWRSQGRPEDYYNEGLLIWLDADQLIREKTAGAKSLDDFAKIFFAAEQGQLQPKTYRFEDVVAALNAVVAHDWAQFLRARVETVQPQAPLEGVARAGWRLVYREEPNSLAKQAGAGPAAGVDLTYSLGLTIANDGAVRDVAWDSPAFAAGLTPNAKILAVGGLAFNADRIKAAVTAAKADKKPIQLLVQEGDRFTPVDIAYYDGLRYPHLERIDNAADGLTPLLTPKT